jgi:hypothetical protein
MIVVTMPRAMATAPLIPKLELKNDLKELSLGL